MIISQIKKILGCVAFVCASFATVNAQPVTRESFSILNLNYPGLEKIKRQVTSGKYDDAASELLKYYRERKGMLRPDFDINELKKTAGKTLTPEIKEAADNALLHRFKPHKAYAYYDFGKDINWQLRPVPDQLFNTFLHRTAIWEPLGRAYWATGNEEYAREWVTQLRHWIANNKPGAYPDDKEFAWKAFVVSFRLNHWSTYFNMFLQSPHFTPAFLMEFLNSYAQQADYVLGNYTDIGNHRLFEAVHMMYAGYSFPQLNKAIAWRKSGIDVLNDEISKQVFADGTDFELSTSYHITAMNIFLNGLEIAQQAGAAGDFPESYRSLTEKMVLAIGKYSFPDYTFPLYGNSFVTNKKQMLNNYRDWAKIFPGNKIIEWYATDGKSGTAPDYSSSALPDAGFYAFRSSHPLDMKSTVMQIKAGPPAFFHSHPDNGNFVLWVKGRDFTPDAGSFIYANVGDQKNSKRDWYRSSAAHQTLTLDGKNIENKAALQKWQPGGDIEILSYTNPSYKNLSHQRSFLFIDKTYFIIIDKAYGDATGKLGIHFNLKENCNPAFDNTRNAITTTYSDGNNLLIQNFNTDKVSLAKEESFVSYVYQEETPRPAFAFEKQKNDAEPQTFITLLYPYSGNKAPVITVKENERNNFANGAIDLTITINGLSKKVITTL